MPIELGFILQRLAAMAEADAGAARPPAVEGGLRAGLRLARGGDDEALPGRRRRRQGAHRRRLQAFAGWTVEEYVAAAARFLRDGRASDARRGRSRDCGYAPMVELLRYLRGERLHGLHRLRRRPRLHARGRRGALRHPARARDRQLERRSRFEERRRRSLVYLAEPDVFDDGPAKPVRIWSRIGRRPIIAVGNSNGDSQMLGSPAAPAGRRCACSCCTTTREREFAYTGGCRGRARGRRGPRTGRW